MSSLTLTKEEIEEITEAKQPAKQLRILRERGYCRAEILCGRVIVERAHYESVARGEFGGSVSKPKPKLRPIREAAI